MGLLNVITDVIKPVTGLIDSLHTSEEEKQQLKTAVTKVENEFAAKVLAYETKLMEAQSKVIVAEAQGESWLQRSWRPVTMLTFLFLIIADQFGWLTFRLNAEAWSLLKIGLGGYVIGRSGEKVAPGLIGMFKKKDGDK